MPRQARRDAIIPGQYYHIYARGNDGILIFRDAADYELYMDLTIRIFSVHRVHLHHFVLMPNHVHFLLHPDCNRLSEAMKRLQNHYTKRFCKKYGFRGHLWQGRFKSKPIDNDANLLACGNYIEMNPVRAGLVRNPIEWPYSSYGYYTSGESRWPIETDPFYPILGKSQKERRIVYKNLVSQTRTDV